MCLRHLEVKYREWSENERNVVGALSVCLKCSYDFHRCGIKGSFQTRLINTQIWKCSAIMVTTVVLVLLSEISALKIDTRLQLRRNKKPIEGKWGEKRKIWFCEIFSNIGSRPRPILWFHLCPRKCFPCQHTSLPVGEHSGCCGFESWHPGSGLVSPLLVVVGWGSQLHKRGHTGLRPEGVKDDCTVNTL